ncbi:MAG: molybdopterin converting factor subunit 1 [Halieaceae bacterium]
MIKVLFFARLREQVGESSLQLSAAEAPATVGELLTQLRQRGQGWDAALADDKLLCAVNQQQVDAGQSIADGDEVAFFPPVTGG